MPSQVGQSAPTPITVTFLERADCHLCDEARVVVSTVVSEFNSEHENETQVSVLAVDIDSDPQLQSQYDWEVPVVLINDRQHSFHRVDPHRFRTALNKIASRTATAEAASGTAQSDSAGRQSE